MSAKAAAIALIAFAIPSVSLACDGGPLFEMMDARLPATPDDSIDVEEVRSTDGGVWEAYLKPGTETVANLVRTDFGEGGRYAARLIVSSPEAYAITTTRYTYSAPYYIEGATTVREEKDIFVYCAGKLMLPAEEFALDPDYAGKAKEALAIFAASEISRYVEDLRR